MDKMVLGGVGDEDWGIVLMSGSCNENHYKNYERKRTLTPA